MIYLVLSLVILGMIAALLGYISHRKTGEEDVILEGSGSCNTCSGDEHLDAFSGRPSDSYTEKEVEQFAEVLYTMQQKEVADWVRSLSLRNISLPNELKDEIIMMIENE